MIEVWLLPPVLALLAGIYALAPLGAQVLKRGVVFIDLAVAQAAAAAALAAIVIAGHSSWVVIQISATIGALLATSLVALLSKVWPAQREALIGLLYVGCSCAVLLIARNDSHGAEHMRTLLAADVLWTDWKQVITLAACAIGVTLVSKRLMQPIWFFSSFAVVVSLAVQILGLFLVFAALIAPGLWHRVGLNAFMSLLMASGTALVGLTASLLLDAPSGPLVALALTLCGVASCLVSSNKSIVR